MLASKGGMEGAPYGLTIEPTVWRQRRGGLPSEQQPRFIGRRVALARTLAAVSGPIHLALVEKVISNGG